MSLAVLVKIGGQANDGFAFHKSISFFIPLFNIF